MTSAKTLYRAHHEQAKRASRHLSLLFWTGVLFSALSYILVARLSLYLLFGTDFLFSIAILPFDPWLIAIVLGVIPIITMVTAYFDERRRMLRTPAKDLAIAMGAEPIRLNGNIHHQRLQNIVEEMAVASGILPPPTLVMANDRSINAFVLGGAERSVALTVSEGALTHLSRDELQALIAHEFGHIINEDVFIYSKLSAMLHGYYIVSEWRYGPQQAISSSRLSFFGGGRDDDDIDLYHLLIGFWGFILLGCGRLIQANFSREREWMADAKSVEYTRNSGALVSVLKKALALQYLQAHTPKNRESVAHFFFINYEPKTNFLKKQTHPPIKERIKRYGSSVSDDEIAALAHEMQEQQRHSSLDNVLQKHQQAFATAMAYPMLLVHKHATKAIKQNQTVQNIDAQMLIYASFIFHSNRTMFELSQSKEVNQVYLQQSKDYLALIEKIHPLEQFYYFEAFCQHLQFSDSPQKSQFIKAVKQLITMDKDFSIYEWCYWLLLKQAIQPTHSQDRHYNELQNEISHVFSFCVCVYSDDPDKRSELFSVLIRQGVPLTSTAYAETAVTTNAFLAVQKDINAMLTLKPIYKQQISAALDTALNSLKTQTLTSIYVKNTLQSLLAG